MTLNELQPAIPGDPSELDFWLHLWGLPANQQNSSKKLSLEIIIRGLQALKNLAVGETGKNQRDAGPTKSTPLWTLPPKNGSGSYRPETV